MAGRERLTKAAAQAQAEDGAARAGERSALAVVLQDRRRLANRAKRAAYPHTVHHPAPDGIRPGGGIRRKDGTVSSASTRRASSATGLRQFGHWSDVLGDRGARIVRVDSGGVLLGALLDLGLIDELALLVHPSVVGAGRRWSGGRRLNLLPAGIEVFDGGVIWMRFCLS